MGFFLSHLLKIESSPPYVFDEKSKVGVVCANHTLHAPCGRKCHERCNWQSGLEDAKTRKRKGRVQGDNSLALARIRSSFTSRLTTHLFSMSSGRSKSVLVMNGQSNTATHRLQTYSRAMDSEIHDLLVCCLWKSNTGLEIGAAGWLATTSIQCASLWELCIYKPGGIMVDSRS